MLVFQLRQLRVICHSLSPDAALALVHEFVFSRIDYCSAIYVALPLGRIGKLERLLRAAAGLVGSISKFYYVSHYMRDVLHWLPISSALNLEHQSGSDGAS